MKSFDNRKENEPKLGEKKLEDINYTIELCPKCKNTMQPTDWNADSYTCDYCNITATRTSFRAEKDKESGE